jgi:2-methylcitrate dehydratase PrpD
MITTKIAAYAATARYDDLPEPVRREASRSIFNILGCMLGGARHSGVDIAAVALGPFA